MAEVKDSADATRLLPFEYSTTQAYVLASDERLAEASSASLAIVAVGLLPLIVLSRQISRRGRQRFVAEVWREDPAGA